MRSIAPNEIKFEFTTDSIDALHVYKIEIRKTEKQNNADRARQGVSELNVGQP